MVSRAEVTTRYARSYAKASKADKGRVAQQGRDHVGREHQATIESKNNHLVRKYGFYYRYDTDAERRLLNQLWTLVNDRLNYLTPTKKPTGFGGS